MKPFKLILSTENTIRGRPLRSSRSARRKKSADGFGTKTKGNLWLILTPLCCGHSVSGRVILWVTVELLPRKGTKAFYFYFLFFLNIFIFLFIFLKTPFLFFFLILFIYLFMAVLGLRFCARAFSSCGKWGPLFIAVRGPLTKAASLVAEHRLQTRRLSSCGSRA